MDNKEILNEMIISLEKRAKDLFDKMQATSLSLEDEKKLVKYYSKIADLLEKRMAVSE